MQIISSEWGNYLSQFTEGFIVCSKTKIVFSKYKNRHGMSTVYWERVMLFVFVDSFVTNELFSVKLSTGVSLLFIIESFEDVFCFHNELSSAEIVTSSITSTMRSRIQWTAATHSERDFHNEQMNIHLWKAIYRSCNGFSERTWLFWLNLLSRWQRISMRKPLYIPLIVFSHPFILTLR